MARTRITKANPNIFTATVQPTLETQPSPSIIDPTNDAVLVLDFRNRKIPDNVRVIQVIDAERLEEEKNEDDNDTKGVSIREEFAAQHGLSTNIARSSHYIYEKRPISLAERPDEDKDFKELGFMSKSKADENGKQLKNEDEDEDEEESQDFEDKPQVEPQIRLCSDDSTFLRIPENSFLEFDLNDDEFHHS